MRTLSGCETAGGLQANWQGKIKIKIKMTMTVLMVVKTDDNHNSDDIIVITNMIIS